MNDCITSIDNFKPKSPYNHLDHNESKQKEEISPQKLINQTKDLSQISGTSIHKRFKYEDIMKSFEPS